MHGPKKVKSSQPISEKKKKTQISNLMKIHPVRAELFHVDGKTDRHGEVNDRFSQICEKRLKTAKY